MRNWFILIWLFGDVLVLILGCGPGSGGQINNAEDAVELAFDIYNWLPPDFSRYVGIADHLILLFLNENLATVFGPVVAEKFVSGAKGSTIRCPSDLTCDFSRPCRWANTRADSLDFYLAKGQPTAESMESYMGVTENFPDDPFLLTAANKGDYRVLFVSDSVPRQEGEGTIEFKAWITPLVELKACTRKPGSGTLDFCSRVFSVGEGPAHSVDIPASQTAFQLVFVVDNFVVDPGGIVFLDDISYHSNLCSADDAGATTTEATETTTSSESPTTELTTQTDRTTSSSRLSQSSFGTDICDAVPCQFFDGSCAYNLRSSLGEGAWEVMGDPTGNPLTGITEDLFGGKRDLSEFRTMYLLADGAKVSPGDIIVAESIQFRLDKAVLIRFFTHIRSARSVLRVCLNDLNNCLKDYRLDRAIRSWSAQELLLDPRRLPSSIRNRPLNLVFAASGLAEHNLIGLSSIQLYDPNGALFCQQSLV